MTSISVKDYPTQPEQARPVIADAIRYVALPKAAKLLLRMWWEVVWTLWHLRWLRWRYET
jgi:hypothetical protein